MRRTIPKDKAKCRFCAKLLLETSIDKHEASCKSNPGAAAKNPAPKRPNLAPHADGKKVPKTTHTVKPDARLADAVTAMEGVVHVRAPHRSKQTAIKTFFGLADAPDPDESDFQSESLVVRVKGQDVQNKKRPPGTSVTPSSWSPLSHNHAAAPAVASSRAPPSADRATSMEGVVHVRAPQRSKQTAIRSEQPAIKAFFTRADPDDEDFQPESLVARVEGHVATPNKQRPPGASVTPSSRSRLSHDTSDAAAPSVHGSVASMDDVMLDHRAAAPAVASSRAPPSADRAPQPSKQPVIKTFFGLPDASDPDDEDFQPESLVARVKGHVATPNKQRPPGVFATPSSRSRLSHDTSDAAASSVRGSITSMDVMPGNRAAAPAVASSRAPPSADRATRMVGVTSADANGKSKGAVKPKRTSLETTPGDPVITRFFPAASRSDAAPGSRGLAAPAHPHAVSVASASSSASARSAHLTDGKSTPSGLAISFEADFQSPMVPKQRGSTARVEGQVATQTLEREPKDGKDAAPAGGARDHPARVGRDVAASDHAPDIGAPFATNHEDTEPR
jgi:hypothetical protein